MTMFCPDEERLSAWVDRALAPSEDESVSVHLAACEECRRAVTIAFLVDRESPETLSDEGERRAFQTVQGALIEPSRCVDDDRLAAWLHDGLAAADRAEVTGHLAECDDCRRAAALTRISSTEPVSALSQGQEDRALQVVLRAAGRDVFFSFWRVAAASLLVAVAATYIAIQWTGAPRPAAPGAEAPATAADGSRLLSYPPGSTRHDGAASVNPTPVPEPPSRPNPAPEPPAEAIVAPARFQPVPVYEWEGIPSPVAGRLSYTDVLRPRGVASINVEGRALVVLDEGTEARLAFAADAGAFVVELSAGRVFVDTAGAEQRWEIRRKDRSVTLRAFSGRAVAEAQGSDLRVTVLRGVADVGSDRVDASKGVDVRPDSSVAVELRKEAAGTLEGRYGKIRPRTLLVLRATAGTSSSEGPWRYVSPSRKAELLEDRGSFVPECLDPIRWVVFALDEPIQFSSDMVLRAPCSGTGTSLYLWVGGSGGWHGDVVRKKTIPEEWPLRGLRGEMVPLVAGENLRKIMIGVVQGRDREQTLEVDGIEIHRVLE